MIRIGEIKLKLEETEEVLEQKIKKSCIFIRRTFFHGAFIKKD